MIVDTSAVIKKQPIPPHNFYIVLVRNVASHAGSHNLRSFYTLFITSYGSKRVSRKQQLHTKQATMKIDIPIYFLPFRRPKIVFAVHITDKVSGW